MDKVGKQSSQGYNMVQIDKTYTLQNLMNKLNRTEPITYGNYFVNFNEIFQKEEDYKDYMKKKVSLLNNDDVDKPEFKGANNSIIKKAYFAKFSDETLFYIFYYMTRDTLQLFAAEQLYKNGWKYHVEHQIWFKETNESTNENLIYFNPLEWKTNQYTFGTVDKKGFLPVEEVKKYVEQLKIENN